ncbi:hypothetical protein RDI58_012918 [Solanum bulbocastanum]|uniref:non-specific serine/threonine protein kinase n=1 Tax=Solanum bulbocastanum TaxID=147425 RepID=A0AAN8TJW8_SOLBU
MGNKYSKGTTSINNASNSSCLASFESFRVYRGVLRDGTKVALKRRKHESEQGIEEFQTESETLCQCHHPYLVSLIGYCDEKNEMILIYDYIENGNLKSHLYGSDLPTMSW